jgi:WD40 repeat protein/serine/threonine protein kinase
MDFINRDTLLGAMQAWVFQKEKRLGQILLEQKALQNDAYALLEALVEKHLELHDQDGEKSLAAVSSLGSVKEALQQIADADLQQSVAHVGTARRVDEASAATRPQTSPPAQEKVRFRILRPYARGGVGQVFVALDEELHREVALKEIQLQHADHPDYRARFLREAEITGGLEHPGIVPIYGLGQYADGRPFYAMRLIKGDNLKSAIERFHQTGFPDNGARLFALRQLLGRFLDVCNALAYAHSRGVLHRDLKPGNIMLGPYGETLVVDWGLAKPLDNACDTHEPTSADRPITLSSVSAGTPTETGQAVGTLEFMSPEQAAGRLDQIGPASDVYSLGATLYALLTNQAAFNRHDENAVQKVLKGYFPPPSQITRHIPRPLDAICLKAMALKPEDRYPSPRELANDLERWLADEPVSAYPESVPTRVARWTRKHQALVTSGGVAAGLILVTVTIGSMLVARSREETARLTTEKALVATIEAELDHNDWSAEHLEKMESLADQLAALAPKEEAQANRDRVHHRFASGIRESLTIGHLEAENSERIRDSINRLRQRDPAGGAELQSFFDNRVPLEKTLVDLAAPFSKARLDAVFNTPLVKVDETGLTAVVDPVLFAKRSNNVIRPVPLFSGNAQLRAQFAAGSWGAAPAVGLGLQYSFGHDAAVNHVAYARDGKLLASASSDGSVMVWDTATGNARSLLGERLVGVTCAEFSPDGQSLALASMDKTVKVLNAATGAIRATLSDFTEIPFKLCFTADGKTLIIASNDGGIKAWDVAAGSPGFVWQAHKGPINGLAMGPDGKAFATAGADGTVKVWETGTWRRKLVYEQHTGAVTCVAWSHDGQSLASGEGLGAVRLWDPATGRTRLRIPGDGVAVFAAAFAPDGKTLATGGNGRTVNLWDTASGQGRKLQGHTERIAAVAFSPDGNQLATASWDRSVWLWDALTWQPRAILMPRYYFFLLSVPQPSDLTVPAQPPTTLDAVLKNGGEVRMLILRNGMKLRDRAEKVKEGPLLIGASREGDRLSFRVNDSPALVFQEVFPFRSDVSGFFSLIWPAGGRLEQLQATCRPAARDPNPLERADLCYAQAQYAEALRLYAAQVLLTRDVRLGREARCKEALCLAKLKRYEEAMPRLEQLAADADDPRWAPVAACQLWLIYLELNRREEANAIIDSLYGRYRPEELAASVSYEVRLQILEAYRPKSMEESWEWIRYDPHRLDNLEHVVAIEDLLGAAPVTRFETKALLLNACQAADQRERAMQLAEEQLRTPFLLRSNRAGIIANMVWLFLLNHDPKRALQLIDSELFEPSGALRRDMLPLLVERARVRVALKEFEPARKDLDRYFRELPAEEQKHSLDAYLLRGWVLELLGNGDGALACWRDGYAKVKGTADMKTLHASILGSLTGDLDEKDGRLMVEGVMAGISGKLAFSAITRVGSFPWPDIIFCLREMWRTPRGRDYARKIAFRQLTYADYFGSQIVLAPAAFMRRGAFPEKISPEDEEILWKTANDLYNTYQAGKINEGHAFQIYLAWMGHANQLGWGGIAPLLPQELRAELAYLGGHRYRNRKSPAEAAMFFQTALRDAPPNSTLQRLARSQVAREKSK